MKTIYCEGWVEVYFYFLTKKWESKRFESIGCKGLVELEFHIKDQLFLLTETSLWDFI